MNDDGIHGWQFVLVVLFWIVVLFIIYTMVPGGCLLDVQGRYDC